MKRQSLNRELQGITVALGVFAIVLSGVFPPWLVFEKDNYKRECVSRQRSFRYALWSPPLKRREHIKKMIDTRQLAIEWSIAVSATVGLCIVLRKILPK